MRNASAKIHMTRITRVEIGRRDYPLVGEFKFFKSGARPSVIVRLTDASGRQGYGQAVPVESWTYETVESVTSTLEHYLAPAVLSADPTDLADVHARMEKRKTARFITHSIPEAVLLADRVVVMSPRPGRMVEIIDIDLPRTRRLDKMPELFSQYTGRIRDIFKASGVLAMD